MSETEVQEVEATETENRAAEPGHDGLVSEQGKSPGG